MTKPKELLCRVGEHWCTDCCKGRNCSNLGDLSDGSRGCLGHSTINSSGAPSQPQLCVDFSCLDFYDIDPDQAKELIQSLPPGEFSMQNILSILAIERTS